MDSSAPKPAALPVPLAFAVQQGISTVLRLDPHTRQALSSINGKVVRVAVTSPALVFHLIVIDGQVHVEGDFDDEPDTTISGSATDLLSLRKNNDALYSGRVNISGDMSTGEQLRNIIAGVDIDFEEIIAPVTGDAVAHQIGQIGAQLSAWFTDTGKSMNRNTSEYLQEEAEIVAPNSEVGRFCNEVDGLREQTDRLEARLSALDKKQQ